MAKGYSEYDLKAVYLYNVLNFTSWPNISAEGLKTICIYGRSPIANSLQLIAKQQKLKPVMKFLPLADLKNAGECNIIYIARTQQKHLRMILEEINNRPILLVSDIEKFAYKGGMIGFVARPQRILLEVNLEEVNHAGIKLGSNLLELATIVNLE